MGADQNLDWGRTAASVLEWWHDAGVDVLVADEPFGWLVPEAAAPAPASPAHTRAAPAQAVAAPRALPDTIDAFLAWRLGPDAPDAAWTTPPIAASGPADADLMVLVDCPERDDRDALLGGPAGRLLDAMLAAIGRSRADVHLAAVCARRPFGGRVPGDVAAELARVALHHAGLVAPGRLLALGDAASRALLATNVIEGRGRLHALNHNDGKTTAVAASFHPRSLLERPAHKAETWKDLQMLMGVQA